MFSVSGGSRMSKKQRYKRRQQGRRKQKTISNSLFILMAGGALLLVAGILFGLQRVGSSEEDGTPVLAVDQQTIDYGDVKLDTNLTFEIKVTNTGDGTLRFKEEPYIQVLEGC
jgi:hypothetical protein